MTAEASLCASNNVDWYKAVLRTHGHTGDIAHGMWSFRGEPPPYYSNAVTLSRAEVDAQYIALAELASALARPFSLKDSFAVLDLAPRGFHPLFDAEWIWLDPRSAPSEAKPDDIDWRRVTSEAELEQWEAAWRANGSPADTRVFLPDLLADETIALFAADRGGRIVAGGAANRSAEVVGFSNFFAEDAGDPSLRRSAVQETARFAPGLPVVGYDRGDALAAARRLGFRTVGPLRVWLTGNP